MNAKIVLDKYLNMLESPELKMSKNTILTYKKDLYKFFEHFSYADKDIKELEKTTSGEYRDFILGLDTLSNGSKNGLIRSVSAFITYLISDEIISDEHFKNTIFKNRKFLPTEKKKITPLSSDEIKKIYASCVSEQERFMIALLSYTGLRESSLVEIKMNDISEDGFFEVFAKGGTKVPVQMSEDCHSLYLMYKQVRNPEEEYLFYPTRGRGMSKGSGKCEPSTIYFRLKSILDRSDLSEERKKEITPHKFRHFFVTAMYKISPETAKQAVHHVSISTTDRYNDNKYGVGLDGMRNLKLDFENEKQNEG